MAPEKRLSPMDSPMMLMHRTRRKSQSSIALFYKREPEVVMLWRLPGRAWLLQVWGITSSFSAFEPRTSSGCRKGAREEVAQTHCDNAS
eukprot:380347-Amphidinium_carterae.1